MQSSEKTQPRTPTPWQKVFAKFGMTRSQLARLLGRHRSKISRAIRCEKGLINGKDQELIVNLAKKRAINISPDDLVPR